MALSFDSATTQALEAGLVSYRLLASFALASGTYYVGNHTPGEYVSILGQNWYGLGQLAQAGSFRTSNGLAADEATLTLDASFLLEVPEGYESEVSWLRDIAREDMVNRRCEIYKLIEHADTGAPLAAIPQFAGPLDSQMLNIRQGKLTIKIRSNRQALGWTNGRTRSQSDQARIKADDGCLRHIPRLSASGGKLPWGYQPTSNGTRTSGAGGGGSSYTRLN